MKRLQNFINLLPKSDMLRSMLLRFCCLLLLLLPALAVAQVHRHYTRPEAAVHYMLKGGWQYTSLMGSNVPASFKAGWNAGVALKLPLRGHWWLQPEILYSKRAVEREYPAAGSREAYQVTYNFKHVAYPLLLVYRPNDIVELQLGPQFATLLSNEVKSPSGTNNSSISPSELNKWEYAVAGGLEVNMSPLALGLRYAYGLRELAKTKLIQERLGRVKLHGLQLYGALVF